jgi:hypothetical protein
MKTPNVASFPNMQISETIKIRDIKLYIIKLKIGKA